MPHSAERRHSTGRWKQVSRAKEAVAVLGISSSAAAPAAAMSKRQRRGQQEGSSRGVRATWPVMERQGRQCSFTGRSRLLIQLRVPITAGQVNRVCWW